MASNRLQLQAPGPPAIETSLSGWEWDTTKAMLTDQALANPMMTAGLSVIALLSMLWLLLSPSKHSKPEMKRDGRDFDSIGGVSNLLSNSDSLLSKDKVHAAVNDYQNNFEGARTGKITTQESVEGRQKNYASMVDSFYNIVTDFYEYGWSTSFHFAPRFVDETFLESLKRAEYYLASRLGLTSQKKVLDVGCGIGGPMRNIARFSGADITGVTINAYQVKIGNRYARQMGLENQCRSVQGDFQKLPFEEATFDAAFEIEATCHSPNRLECFSQVFKVLKPGGMFAGYEWVVTDKYDPEDRDHVRLKEGIEVGNGLPTLATPQDVLDALTNAGFEIVEAFDPHAGVHEDANQTPWYSTLQGSWSWSGFRMSKTGAFCTHVMVWTLETLRIAPKGSTKVSSMLRDTSVDIVESGKRGIFTPSYCFVVRKPLNA